MRPLRLAAGCTALVLAGAAVGVRARDATPPVAAEPPPQAITVTAPSVAAAGTPLSVTVALAPGVHAATAQLAAESAMGTAVLSAPVRAADATFTVPARVTAVAGQLVLQAQAGAGEGTAVVRIAPGLPAGNMTPLPGAKGIVTGGVRDQILVTPEDVYGNPVRDGTRVDVTLLRPNHAIMHRSGLVTDLVATIYIASGRLAGWTAASATSGGAHGGEAAVLETAGRPIAHLGRDRTALPADGRSLVTLVSGSLTDPFGNPIPDGTAVQFELSGVLGRAIVPAEVIGGVAEATVRAPQIPGRLQIRLQAFGSVSQTGAIAFTPTVTTRFPVRTRWTSKGLQVTAGPVLNWLGAWVADGTVVTVTATAPGHRSSGAGATESGVTTVTLASPAGVPTAVTVSAGGRTERLVLRPTWGTP